MAKSKAPSKTEVTRMFKDGQDDWEKSQQQYEDNFAGEPIPTDTYAVRLVSAEGGLIAEKLAVKAEYEIASGEYLERVVSDTLWLHTPGAMAYFRNWVIMHGYEPPETKADIPELLDKMVKEAPVISARIVQKEDSIWPDINYQKLIEDFVAEEREPEAGGEPVDLDSLSRKELKGIIKDEELDITVYKDMSDDDVRDAIREALNAKAETGEPAREEEREEEAGELEPEVEKLDNMDRAKLKKLIKDENLDIVVYKDMSDDDVREAIRALDNPADDDEPSREVEKDDEPSRPSDSKGGKYTLAELVKMCANQDVRLTATEKKDEKKIVKKMGGYD